MTDAQKKWLDDHPTYRPIGPPKPGIAYGDGGTLYANGTFIEFGAPMTASIVLDDSCIGVGIPRELSHG